MRWILFIAAGMSVAGCATHSPDPLTPDGMPSKFSESGNVSAPVGWWEAFGDAGLNEVLAVALADNFTLRAAWDRLAQAEAVARRQGAALRPEVDVLASGSRVRREDPAEGGAVYRNEFSAGLVAGYELDLWGRVRSARDAARLDAAASADQVQVAAITVAAEAATVWMQRAEQSEQVTLLRRQVDVGEKILDVLQQRFRSGQSSAVDVWQQEQLVEARRGDLAAAASRLAVLENQLRIFMGKPPGAPLAEADGLPGLPPLPGAGVPADVLTRRPDIRRAWYQVLAADRRMAAAVADRFPRLSITGRLTTTEPRVEDLFSDWLASLAGNLVGPIVDGGMRRAEAARTEAAVSEALNLYRHAVLTALTEVENALVREQQQGELVERLARQVQLAGQVVDRTREGYLRGNEDFLRVLTADLTWQNLERTRLVANRELLEIRIGLYRALGGGLELERPPAATLITKKESPP